MHPDEGRHRCVPRQRRQFGIGPLALSSSGLQMKKAQPNQAMTGVIALGGIASALDATKTKAPSVGETHRASAVPTLVEASPMIVIDTERSSCKEIGHSALHREMAIGILLS